MATERRAQSQRRTPTKAPKKVVPDRTELRRRERRMGDRRESPRLPIKVWVKNPASNKFQQVQGDISVGGMLFHDALPIDGKHIDLRFKLPGRAEEVHVHGDVIDISKKESGYAAHIRFGEMDLDTQRAIARFIDANTKS